MRLSVIETSTRPSPSTRCKPPVNGLAGRLRKLLSPAGPGLLLKALRFRYWHSVNQLIYLRHGLGVDNECVGDFMPNDVYWRLPEAGSVLDIGCGVGSADELLASEGRPVLALDIDPRCVAYAQRHHASESLRFTTCSAERFAARHPGPYAAIFTSNVFEHLDEAGAVIADLAAQLAPGGVVIFAVPPIFDEAERARQNAVEFHRSNHLVCEWEALLRAHFSEISFYAHRYQPRKSGRIYDTSSAPVRSLDLDERDFTFTPVPSDSPEARQTLTAIFVLRLTNRPLTSKERERL